jgi:uncharacterized alkaline shock family protein YloU
MAVNDETRLGCGRPVEDVWATAESPPNAHEQTCPFCQDARHSLQQLAEATDALVVQEAEAPEYAPASHLKDLVMQLVHVEVRRGRPVPLLNSLDGTPPGLTISKQAVLDVIWRAADGLSGVRARHCQIELEAAAQEPGRPAAVNLGVNIAVAAGISILEVTDKLRTRLQEQIATETGLATRRINVTVEDLYDE